MPANGLNRVTAKERGALNSLVALLRKRYPKRVKQVILFGSRARGDATRESDFDVLVVTANGGKKFEQELTDWMHAIGEEHKLDVMSHAISEKELQTRGKQEPFYRSVLSEGIDLLGAKPHRLSRGKPLVYRPPTKGFKMDESTRIQIGIRLERARQYLAEAQALVEKEMFPGAVSRAYYAVFMLTTAVLLTLDLVRAKHSGVEPAFSEYFIKPKLLEEEYKDIFERARKERELADYKFKEYSQEQAQEIIGDCERFIGRMEKYLRDVGALKR